MRSLAVARQKLAAVLVRDQKNVSQWKAEAQLIASNPSASGRRLLYKALRKAGPVLRFSENLSAEHGEAMFRHACALGLEGVISKRLDKPCSSGRCQHWRKVKNPL
jgi:bifunctional non-homologous end joining protein LigD